MTLLRIAGFLWALPHTIVGLLLAIPYGVRRFRWIDGVIVAEAERMIGSPSAQTHGTLVFVDATDERIASLMVPGGRLWRHEVGGHVRDGMILGPLHPIAYGAEWLFRFAFMPGNEPRPDLPRWQRAYWSLSWERRARARE